MILRPVYTKKIMAYADTPFVKILTGIRRCGKSTILKMLMEEIKKRDVTYSNQKESFLNSYRKIYALI